MPSRSDRNQVWRDGVLISEQVVQVDTTVEVNRTDIDTALDQARPALQAIIASSPDPAAVGTTTNAALAAIVAAADLPAGTLTAAQLSAAVRQLQADSKATATAVLQGRVRQATFALVIRRLDRWVRNKFDGSD